MTIYSLPKFNFRFRHCLLGGISVFIFFSHIFLWSAELIYDGDFVQKVQITSYKGEPCLPLKSIAALFKGSTQWFPIAGKVVLQVSNRKISFTVDSRTVSIGERKVNMSSPARMIKGTVFVPIHFFLTDNFTDIVDCKVQWSPASQILNAEPRISLHPPRIYSRSNLTRIVLESLEEITPIVKRKDDSILVEIPKARIGSEDNIKINDKVIKSLKTTHARKGTSLKISLAEKVTSYVWFQEKDPYRLVIEIHNPQSTSSLEREEFAELNLTDTVKTVSTPTVTAVQSMIAATENGKIRKIVVDAGHGGEDTGAVGRMGTKEKDINLNIALELARVLQIEGGYEVYLTRQDDTFVTLLDRSLSANAQKADLFVSIHCNASIKRSQGGFEIYFLAEDASDPHAEATAEFENTEIDVDEHPGKGKELQELLSSMAQTEFINESSLLCNMINKAVQKRLQIESRGVKQANFHVLHGVQMPSVLVETAFITHSPEEQKLRQRKFRSAIVDAILTGIQNYERQLKYLLGVAHKK